MLGNSNDILKWALALIFYSREFFFKFRAKALSLVDP